MLFPATPGVSVSGYTGDGWIAQGDVLTPLVGKSTNFTYIDPQVYYHSRSGQGEYSGSLGIGQRWLTANSIWGGYVFGDYNRSADNQDFWFVSPGIERLGRTWDFSVNGYIPVSKQRIDTGTEFADQTGDFSQIIFSGHNQYDQLVTAYESTGWGADATIGVRLPFKNLKLFVGSYYFAPQDNSEILGGVVRAQLPINDYFSIAVNETYDNNKNNTLSAGLSVSLGGRYSGANFNGDLSQRLVDPVQRQLSIPITEGTQNTGQTALEASNISFFVSDNSATDSESGDGTFEDPYHGFSQTNIDDANQKNNRNFYLNSGDYTAEYGSSNDAIILNNDQLYGRQDDFYQPAQGNNRPILDFSQSGLAVSATDSFDSVTGLILTGTGVGSGINLSHTDNSPALTVDIKNTSVTGFNFGVGINNSATTAESVNIFNSNISANLNQGIQAQNQSQSGLTLNINNTDIEGNGASGIYAVDYQRGNLAVNINSSTISNNVNNGIYALNEFNSNTLTLNVSNSIVANNAYHGIELYNGMGAYNTNTGNLVTNINASNITGNGQNGINANNTSTDSLTLNIDNSHITDNLGHGIVAVNFGDTGSFILNLRRSSVTGNQVNGLEIFNEKNSGSFNLVIEKSTIADNGSDGIFMDNSASSGNLVATISHSTISNNGIDGIYALNDLSSGAFTLSVANSAINGNRMTGVFLDNRGQSSWFTTRITGSQMTANGLNGISAINEGDNSQLSLSVANSVIADNKNGIALNQTATAGDLTAVISSSKIINNNGKAMSVNNGATAIVDHSVIAGNVGGISVIGNSSIQINDPVYLNADISNYGGTVQLNGINAPAGSSHATCILGVCYLSLI